MSPLMAAAPSSPLGRGGKFESARIAEVDLVRIAWVGERGNGVGQVANAERNAHGFDVRITKILAGNVHKRIDVRRGVGVHYRGIILIKITVSDMAHRGADLERPSPMVETIGRAGVDDDRRNVRGRIAGPARI